MKVFVGYDTREDIAYQVCKHSLEARNKDVIVKPLVQSKLRDAGWYTRPVDRLASTEFTFTRFLIPELTNFSGWALFCDSDRWAIRGNHRTWWQLIRSIDIILAQKKYK